MFIAYQLCNVQIKIDNCINLNLENKFGNRKLVNESEIYEFDILCRKAINAICKFFIGCCLFVKGIRRNFIVWSIPISNPLSIQ